MGGQGPDELDESEVTPDETYDTEGTIDALTLEQLQELELAGYDEDADQVLSPAGPGAQGGGADE
jgi:hypothetical protein